jgi:hypothetical protein
MPFAKKPSAYVSPAAWAREIMAQVANGKPPDLSKTTLDVARRIDALPPLIKRDLDALEAPKHVYRWVAWAPANGPRRFYAPAKERADLVLHLRRTFERGDEDGWFLERELGAALRVWMEEVQAARKRGGIPPSADQIPPERYVEAIAASADRPPRAPGAKQRALAKQIARKISQG